MSEIQRYVAGFAFNYTHSLVALVKKSRPQWQAGRLNGIGGHIELGENPNEAMVREFLEETGVKTKADDWRLYQVLQSNLWEVSFFYTICNIQDCTTQTDEEIIITDVNNLPGNCITNLYWLIPLAVYHNRFSEEFPDHLAALAEKEDNYNTALEEWHRCIDEIAALEVELKISKKQVAFLKSSLLSWRKREWPGIDHDVVIENDLTLIAATVRLGGRP
jgi:8-oxo-dGTP diphosphatase